MVKFYNEDLRQELLFEIYKIIPKYEPLKKLTLKNEETSKIYLIYKNISRSKYYKSFIKKYKIKDDIEDKKSIVELINIINEFYLFCNENQFKNFISVICKRRRIDFYRKNKISNDLNNFRLNDIASDGEEYIYKVIDEKNTNKFEVDYSLLSNKDREFLKLFFEDGVRMVHTFIDDDEFTENWGYGDDNCGNPIVIDGVKFVVRKGKKLDKYNSKGINGIIGIASDLVKFDKKYDQIVLSLLGKTVVVEDMDTAIALAKQNSY